VLKRRLNPAQKSGLMPIHHNSHIICKVPASSFLQLKGSLSYTIDASTLVVKLIAEAHVSAVHICKEACVPICSTHDIHFLATFSLSSHSPNLCHVIAHMNPEHVALHVCPFRSPVEEQLFLVLPKALHKI
jgi:hypothetical protein